MDIPRFLRAMAKLVEDHTEEFAACFGNASVGSGVKDDATAPAHETLPQFKVGDHVHVVVHLPQFASPSEWTGDVVSSARDTVAVRPTNALPTENPTVFRRAERGWRAYSYPHAILIDLERAS